MLFSSLLALIFFFAVSQMTSTKQGTLPPWTGGCRVREKEPGRQAFYTFSKGSVSMPVFSCSHPPNSDTQI